MNISLFNRAYEKSPESTQTIDQFLDDVKNGKYKEQVEQIRSEENKEIKRKLKVDLLPAVSTSGVFNQRNQDGLLEHSGFISIDIDGVDTIKGIEHDEYTYASARSVGGNGFFVIVKINPEKHKESFLWLAEYYYKTYGIMVDTAPQNVASLRFHSYDPDLIINKKSKRSGSKNKPKPQIKKITAVLTGQEVDTLIQEAYSKNANICESYFDWLKVGFALADHMGENGRSHFHTLSSMSSKYKASQTDKQYNACLKGNKDGITIGTLYWLLKNEGVTIPMGQREEVRFTALRKSNGAKSEDIKNELKELHGRTEEEANAIVKAVDDVKDLDLSKLSDSLSEVIPLVIEWIKQYYPTYRNEITGHYVSGGKSVMGGYLNKIILDAKIAFNAPILTTQLFKEIILSEKMPVVNPLKDGFTDLEPYTDELERMIQSVVTTDEMGPLFIRKWLLSLIAAINGEPVRIVLALTGGQHTGKTEWFRRLLPDWLKPYYGESKLDSEKDDKILMTEKLIILDDEGGGKSAKDAKAFKTLTSADVFNLRKPYDAVNGNYKRLAVLAITSNNPNVINDTTGNTRILPINVIDIDKDLYNSVDKKKLFHQLHDLYFNHGEDWHFTSDERIKLQEISDDFESENPERDLLLKFFRIPEDGEYNEVISKTSSEIKAMIERTSGYKFNGDVKFFSELNSLFGSTKKTTRRDGKTPKCYHLKFLGQDSKVGY